MVALSTIHKFIFKKSLKWRKSILNMVSNVTNYLIFLLKTDYKPWYSVTTLNINPTLLVICCKFSGIIDLQCCNYCHLPSDFSFKFQSSMTIFHPKLLTREGWVLANG